MGSERLQQWQQQQQKKKAVPKTIGRSHAFRPRVPIEEWFITSFPVSPSPRLSKSRSKRWRYLIFCAAQSGRPCCCRRLLLFSSGPPDPFSSLQGLRTMVTLIKLVLKMRFEPSFAPREREMVEIFHFQCSKTAAGSFCASLVRVQKFAEVEPTALPAQRKCLEWIKHTLISLHQYSQDLTGPTDEEKNQ